MKTMHLLAASIALAAMIDGASAQSLPAISRLSGRTKEIIETIRDKARLR